MKRSLQLAAQFSVLGATAFVLIATSPAPPQCAPEGPIRYAVNGSCGPSGYLTVSNDGRCQLSTTGAEAVNLPAQGGSFDGTSLTSGFSLSEFEPRLEDGGFAPDAGHQVANLDGGTPHVFTSCAATPTANDGAGSALSFSCNDRETGAVVCTGTLVEEGPLHDAGTPDAGTPDAGTPDAGP